MAFPPGYSVTELQNAVVADPVCEANSAYWTASYKTGQDLHIEVDVPDTSPGAVYGLNQTLYLAVRTGIYQKGDGEEIQLWRTPPQNPPFDFKGEWLDSESSDSNDPHFPYYSAEAVAKTELRREKVDGKDAYFITLRMRKTPQIALPTQIRRKSDKEDKLTIKQFDVQEGYLITLFRDEDLKSEKRIPLVQWRWEYKYAWGSCNGEPQFVAHPSFVQKCTRKDTVMDKFKLMGPTLANGGCYDHFRVLDKDELIGEMGEVRDWKTKVTDEWEACDA